MTLMLEVMRKHSKSFLIYVLFGIIIIVFIISFGPGSVCAPPGERIAAEVNGRNIPVSEFENIYNHDPRFQFKDRREDTAESRQAAMDQLIERELLALEAGRLGIRIGDEDLAKRIRRLSWLQKDGKFDMEHYKRWAMYMNSSVPVLEERLRKDFLGDELRSLVLSSVQVSDTEVEAEWQNRNTKVNLEYIELNPEDAKTQTRVTRNEVLSWKEKNRKKIEEHWTSKKFLYFARKQYRLRQIALRAAAAKDAKAQGEIRKKLEGLRKEVEGGKDFAEIAKASSEDPATKDKGGDLGLLERKEMSSPEFRKAVGDTPVGKTSTPFCDKTWCRIVKVESTRERELKELEDEIAEELLKEERATAGMRAQAEAILAKVKADRKVDLKSLAPHKKVPQTEEEKKAAAEKKARQRKLQEALRKALAKTKGAKAEVPPGEDEKGPYGQTGLFARSRNFLVPKMGISKELMKAAFELQSKGDVVPRVLEVDKKLFVARLLERPAVSKPKDEDLDLVRKELTFLKQARLYEAWLDALRKGAKVSVNRAVLRPPATRKGEEEKSEAPPKKRKKS